MIEPEAKQAARKTDSDALADWLTVIAQRLASALNAIKENNYFMVGYEYAYLQDKALDATQPPEIQAEARRAADIVLSRYEAR